MIWTTFRKDFLKVSAAKPVGQAGAALKTVLATPVAAIVTTVAHVTGRDGRRSMVVPLVMDLATAGPEVTGPQLGVASAAAQDYIWLGRTR